MRPFRTEPPASGAGQEACILRAECGGRGDSRVRLLFVGIVAAVRHLTGRVRVRAGRLARVQDRFKTCQFAGSQTKNIWLRNCFTLRRADAGLTLPQSAPAWRAPAEVPRTPISCAKSRRSHNRRCAAAGFATPLE